MKFIKVFSLVLCTMYYVLCTVPSVHAESTEPFPPFSVEGNPDEAYHFDALFPLFRYIRPAALKIYENRDRDRNYDTYEMCAAGDFRDQVCSIDGQTGRIIDECEGGDVNICYKGTQNVAYVANSKSGSCTARRNPNSPTAGEIIGECDYSKRPTISNTVKGTDFASSAISYPKYQNEAYAFGYMGTDNAISWGSQYLNSSFCEVALRKILVVRRARQTKTTVANTGEWPLGWVDWGYQVGIDHDLDPKTPTSGTKTLLEIDSGLPDSIAGPSWGMIEQLDDMYMNPGNYDLLVGLGNKQARICDAVSLEASKSTPDQWYVDLMSAPLYPPSFRQGFIRPSICKWNLCCPGLRCPLPDELLIGTRRGLYYDLTVSQAFGGALDQLFMTYPLKQAMKIFIDLSANNQLIRFASSASEQALPAKIHQKLSAELKGTCTDYVPWSGWNSFGTIIDYLEEDSFLGPNNTCPTYQIQPDLTKDKAGSFSESNLSWLLRLIWGEKTDEVEPIVYHLITIPDAMGQSIKELQQGYYDTRDTLRELESVKDFNEDLSATIDDEADLLLGGKTMGPADTRRRFGYYTCSDPMFSSQLDTSVEQYALGTRVGCDEAGQDNLDPNAVCDGKLFGELIAGSGYEAPSSKGQSYFDTYIKASLTDELMATYANAEKETGVPCEILAGIHFVEGANSPTASLVSGRQLGTPEPDAGGKVFKTLLDTATYAGEHLKGKVGGNINDAETAITALSRYNGGGNSNCQLGYPYPIPYNGCPRQFEGEDDPYPTSFIDNKHDNMYLLYCADRTACMPQVFQRPGSFAVALAVYNGITKGGYAPSELPKAPSSPNPQDLSNPAQPGSGQAGFFPVSCGEGTLATALGCLPYAYQPFVTTLLRFLIGISGGIALVVMLTGVFRLMTSGGDTKAIQSGRDLFSAGVAGLLLVIFSVSLLRLVAADILKLPGF